MKIYPHINPGGFSNCYIIANENTKEAILIDPGEVTEEIIDRIEGNSFTVAAVLVTHNHGSHVNGLKTIMKIYSPKIYAADWEIVGNETNIISGNGKLKLANLTVKYMTIPGHTADSMIFKIENVLFTGDSLSAGLLGNTNSSYSSHILRANIEEKIFSQSDKTIILPGHGPPTTVGSEKRFNIDMTGKNSFMTLSRNK